MQSGAHVRGAGEIGVETLCFALADKIYQYLPANEGLLGAKVDGNVQNLALAPDILRPR